MNSSVIGKFAEDGVNFLFQHFRGGFDAFSASLGAVIKLLQDGLAAIPFVAMLVILVAFALWRRGVVFSVFVGLALLAIHYMGLWAQTVSTLALVIAATFFSLVVGVPLGIWGARNKRVEMILRSLLDFMQTMPAFVYLIPAVILFGLGRVPAVIATIVFAMPPVVRLTTLGIRQVREELLEAGRAFGSTDMQLLWKIQLPNALPSIMAGVNQTIMMALSMVVVASMIGAGGLGEYVLSGIQRLDIGIGFEGGLGVVLLAIVLDRLTESFGVKAKKKVKRVTPGTGAAKAGTHAAART
ncbi:ABC transporter permease [Paraburkholderia sp. 22099]|jgi:glycine betaine/proline transport system permease protein|uniref:Glycine betaine/proline transport system permease protein n=1 Tax=Paraburkholderia terricola TaxID=169427 RepID=A0A1M6L1N1_9BURK|nr:MULTISPECIES: proline/glycine betaine ABC transporter permease [Paraburkholderia]AXE92106.1 choline ABC transporter permease subunit [Paraburkholderia terricola]SDN81719.1 glycine betaine/proline transport system permease protein [Paraburkholderia sediminicola]SHJ65073.1 glycine betaine/proline transport system permease protein [Paraburkholderia terricola]